MLKDWIWSRVGFKDNAEVLVWAPRSGKLPLTKMENAMGRAGLKRENQKCSLGQAKLKIPTIRLSDEQLVLSPQFREEGDIISDTWNHGTGWGGLVREEVQGLSPGPHQHFRAKVASHGCVVRIQWNDTCKALKMYCESSSTINNFAHTPLTPCWPLPPLEPQSYIPGTWTWGNSSLFRKEADREKKILFSPSRLQRESFLAYFPTWNTEHFPTVT